MKLKINVVDAFTNKIFKGNSAAVILIDDWLEDDLMQSIAVENNLSETAFVKRNRAQNFDIRWFSPLTEIDFCGHASLAAAYVIFDEIPGISKIFLFAKAVGDFSITKKESGFFEMNFPSRPPKVISDVPEALLKGLSIKPDEILLNNQAYFAVYSDEKDVKRVEQDSDLLKTLAPYDVVVTAKSSEYDFISRYFWPANGGDEDPVTGSIHTGLAPYWAKQLNKKELVAYQASTRGGVLHCKVSDERIYISGQAVQYLVGEITV